MNSANNSTENNSTENNSTKPNNCIICFKKINYLDVNESFKTKCNHFFHYNCINSWININNSCPTCRTPNIFKNREKFILSNNYYSRNKLFNYTANVTFI